jgi:hypothetical protein
MNADTADECREHRRDALAFDIRHRCRLLASAMWA